MLLAEGTIAVMLLLRLVRLLATLGIRAIHLNLSATVMWLIRLPFKLQFYLTLRMWLEFFETIAAGIGLFSGLDRALTWYGFEGVYYLVHGLHNMMIVQDTWTDVSRTLTEFHRLDEYPVNYSASALVFALHFYHILLYRHKFKYDDWLHHGLMIFVALPLGILLPASTLTGFSLFFSTGLPSVLDYFLLFGVRNNWILPLTEKLWNRRLNVWLRAPGCIAHATLALTFMLSSESVWWLKGLGCIPAGLMYWNGQYFMEQVIADHAVRSARLE
jgi:hypothetical protein